MGTLDETGFPLEVVAHGGAVVLVVACETGIDEHEVGGEDLDVGLSVTFGEEVETALCAR